MSYILDALRKAETERALARVSRIASPRQPGIVYKGGALKRLIPVVLATILTMVLTWWWTSRGIADAEEDTNSSSATFHERVAAEANAPHLARSESGQPVTESGLVSLRSAAPAKSPESHPKTVVEMTAPTNNRSDHRAVAPQTPVLGKPADKKANEETPSALPQETSLLSPEVVHDAEDRVVALIASEAEQMLSPQTALAPASDTHPDQTTAMEMPGEEESSAEVELPPLLRTLPYRFQSTLPKMVINAQAYTEEVDTRFVIINMKKYREGDRTEAGVVVETIAEGYLVMSYQGQVFRMGR